MLGEEAHVRAGGACLVETAACRVDDHLALRIGIQRHEERGLRIGENGEVVERADGPKLRQDVVDGQPCQSFRRSGVAGLPSEGLVPWIPHRKLWTWVIERCAPVEGEMVEPFEARHDEPQRVKAILGRHAVDEDAANEVTLSAQIQAAPREDEFVRLLKEGLDEPANVAKGCHGARCSIT
jgi:hypothetical protein